MPSNQSRAARARLRALWTGVGTVLLVTAAWAATGGLESLLVAAGAEPTWGPELFTLLLVVHGFAAIVVGRRSGFEPQEILPTVSTSGGLVSPRTARWFMAALCLVALALRLFRLESGLWHDEIGTLVEFVRPEPATILTSFRNQNQHMLYSLLAHASIAVFGETAAALRLPAALFGTATVPALYVLARRVASRDEALLAAGLLTTSYHHIWFSQNARGYTGVLLFTLLATWHWLEALDRNDRRRWLLYSGTVALGMWVHLTMAFVVAAHGLVFLVLLFTGRGNDSPPGAVAAPTRAFGAFALAVTSTLQLYALGLPSFFASGLHEVSLDSEWISPWWLLAETVRGLTAGFSGPTLVVGTLAVGASFLLLVVGWVGLWRRSPPLAAVAVLPGLLVVGLMILLRHNLWPRFLFFTAGFALLIVARGAFVASGWTAARLSWPARRGRQVAVALVAILVVLSLAALPGYYALPKQDYVGAMEQVEADLGPAGLAVAVGLARVAYGRYYAVDNPRWVEAEDAAELERIHFRHPDLRVVYSLPTHLRRWHPDLWRLLQEDFEEVGVFPGTLRGGAVHVLKPRFPPEPTG